MQEAKLHDLVLSYRASGNGREYIMERVAAMVYDSYGKYGFDSEDDAADALLKFKRRIYRLLRQIRGSGPVFRRLSGDEPKVPGPYGTARKDTVDGARVRLRARRLVGDARILRFYRIAFRVDDARGRRNGSWRLEAEAAREGRDHPALSGGSSRALQPTRFPRGEVRMGNRRRGHRANSHCRWGRSRLARRRGGASEVFPRVRAFAGRASRRAQER